MGVKHVLCWLTAQEVGTGNGWLMSVHLATNTVGPLYQQFIHSSHGFDSNTGAKPTVGPSQMHPEDTSGFHWKWGMPSGCIWEAFWGLGRPSMPSSCLRTSPKHYWKPLVVLSRRIWLSAEIGLSLSLSLCVCGVPGTDPPWILRASVSYDLAFWYLTPLLQNDTF